MKQTQHKLTKVTLGVLIAFAFVPSAAFASARTLQPVVLQADDAGVQAESADDDRPVAEGALSSGIDEAAGRASAAVAAVGQRAEEEAAQAEAASRKTDYVIEYDRALIDQIGTQEQSGHTICCPSFSCAYADAVLDGTVRDHSYYSCYSCRWPDWGGGDSSFRDVGSDEQVLREAYDQISQGRPTVVHVAASYGEHWIALIGYQDAVDPDHLTLANFIALDPWDGSQLVASERFSLYGDGCQHVSDR